MPPRSKIPPEAPPAPEPEIEPPFYEATEDLYVGNPESGSVPVLAYRAGDRVVPDVVEPNGWGGKVRVPAVFEGQLNPPRPDPEDGPDEKVATPPGSPKQAEPPRTPASKTVRSTPDEVTTHAPPEVTAPASHPAGPARTDEE